MENLAGLNSKSKLPGFVVTLLYLEGYHRNPSRMSKESDFAVYLLAMLFSENWWKTKQCSWFCDLCGQLHQISLAFVLFLAAFLFSYLATAWHCFVFHQFELLHSYWWIPSIFIVSADAVTWERGRERNSGMWLPPKSAAEFTSCWHCFCSLFPCCCSLFGGGSHMPEFLSLPLSQLQVCSRKTHS